MAATSSILKKIYFELLPNPKAIWLETWNYQGNVDKK